MLARGFEDVRRHALAGRRLTLVIEHDRDLAESVLSAGDRVDAELAQPRVQARGRVDRSEDRVHRPVAGERPLDRLALRGLHRDGGVRRAPR